MKKLTNQERAKPGRMNDLQVNLDITKRSICGAEKFGCKSSTRFAPLLRTSECLAQAFVKHTPRKLRGVRVTSETS